MRTSEVVTLLLCPPRNLLKMRGSDCEDLIRPYDAKKVAGKKRKKNLLLKLILVWEINTNLKKL